MMRPVAAVALIAAIVTGFSAPGVADISVADFYRGKTMELIVGTGAGGGYDATARLVARHLGRLLPGNPRIVVTNIPGSSGIQAANDLYNKSARDGSVIGTFTNAMITVPLFGNGRMLFEPAKFTWIGSVNHEDGICIATQTSGVTSWNEATRKELIVGVATAGATTYMYPVMLRNLFGAKFKFVSGYPDSTQIALAIQRGEVQSVCQTYSSIKNQHSDWLRDRFVEPLIALGFNRIPDLPDVPTVFEFARDPEQQNILKVILTPTVAGRPFVAPPDIPQDRANALRDAFEAMTTDQMFLQEARMLRMEVQPERGRDVETLIRNIYALPASVVAKTKLAVTIGNQGQ